MPVLLGHARLALPAMVIGIEPGAARTTSPTLMEVAELTSLLTTVSLSAIFSRYAPRFFVFDNATSCSVPSCKPQLRRTDLSWIVASISSGECAARTDQRVCDAADDKQFGIKVIASLRRAAKALGMPAAHPTSLPPNVASTIQEASKGAIRQEQTR